MGGKHKPRGQMTPEERQREREKDQKRRGADDKRSARYRQHLASKADQQRERMRKSPAKREENRKRSADWRASMSKAQYEDYLAGQRKRNAARRQRLKTEKAAGQDAELARAEQHLEDTLEAYRLGVRNFRRFERQSGVTAARLESARKGVAELRREVLRAHAAVERIKAAKKHKRG